MWFPVSILALAPTICPTQGAGQVTFAPHLCADTETSRGGPGHGLWLDGVGQAPLLRFGRG